ncbi:MAG: carboxypeptidase-like regulatory domain-containing protein [Bacteroidales bacterium]|nr:carboxypeptidase-like regulatory domain-containing protein [Bacteroidales bacterium]
MKRIVLSVIAGLLISSVAFSVEKENPSAPKSKSTTSVAGMVVDKETGESLAGVTIRFSGISQVVYTDLEGKFEIQDVIPGIYELEAALISYKQSSNKVKLAPGNGNNIEVELENL